MAASCESTRSRCELKSRARSWLLAKHFAFAAIRSCCGLRLRPLANRVARAVNSNRARVPGFLRSISHLQGFDVVVDFVWRPLANRVARAVNSNRARVPGFLRSISHLQGFAVVVDFALGHLTKQLARNVNSNHVHTLLASCEEVMYDELCRKIRELDVLMICNIRCAMCGLYMRLSESH